jgi:hypothetical protein
MSERAIAFVEEWVGEHVNAEGYTPERRDSMAAALAVQCAADAKEAGIPDSEMKDAFEDLTAFMAGQIELANDNEADRLAKDD